MKCSNCNSEWNTENEINVCPFCGKELFSDSDFSTIENTLKFVVATYGIEIYSQPSRLISYLGDYAPQLSNERRLVKMCADASVIRDMVNANGNALEEKQIIIDKSILKLENEFFLNKEWASKVVYWIAFSLSWENKQVVPDVVLEKDIEPAPEHNHSAPVIPKQINEVRLVIENGSANYVGEAVNGVPQGYGKATYKSGGTYEGQWHQGHWHGHGKHVSSDGPVYEGEFANSEYSGTGKLIFKDGDYYEGQFKHYKFNGQGKMTFLDSNLLYREGMWVDSKMSGKGKEIYRDGKNL